MTPFVSKRRGSKGFARFQPSKKDPLKYRVPNPKSTPKEIHGRHGHKPHGKSIYWPALYEHLRAKGYSKAKAAAISNAAWKKKRVGLATNTPTSVRGVVKSGCEIWDGESGTISIQMTPDGFIDVRPTRP